MPGKICRIWDHAEADPQRWTVKKVFLKFLQNLQECSCVRVSYSIKFQTSGICLCAYQGVRNVRFSENLACSVFLNHPFWDSPFCLITDALSLNFSSSLTNLILSPSASNKFQPSALLSLPKKVRHNTDAWLYVHDHTLA